MIETITYRKDEGISSSEDEPPSIYMPNIQIATVLHPQLGMIADESTKQFIKKQYPDHVYQELGSGWCGPAVLSRVFTKAGVPMTQEQIAFTVLSDGKPLYDSDWGTSHDRLKEFLSIYFHSFGFEKNSSLKRIEKLKQSEMEVILNVRARDDWGEDGHYVSVYNIDKDNQLIVISDPTNGIRKDGLHGVYSLPYKKLKEEWWDYATARDEREGIKTRKVLCWVDPLSIKNSAISQQMITL